MLELFLLSHIKPRKYLDDPYYASGILKLVCMYQRVYLDILSYLLIVTLLILFNIFA